MKTLKALLYLIIPAFFVGLLYLSIAYVKLNLNLLQWPETSRMGFALFGLIVIISGIIAADLINQRKDNR